MNNALYLRRRNKICLPAPEGISPLPDQYLASLLKNIEGLGFTFSRILIEACQRLTLEQLSLVYVRLVSDLQEAVGDKRPHKPMYPNFPTQVMEISRGQLYLNAILHYVTSGRHLPVTEAKERLPILDNVNLKVIELGTLEEFEGLLAQIVGSNTSLSVQDREDVVLFFETYGSDIVRLLPEAIPQKETVAFVASLLMKHTENSTEFIARFCRTGTDILRLAVALSDGDLSLATATRFRSFSRSERGLLLALLERLANPVEEMLRWKGRWIRLGERLHPGEYAKRYPRVAEAFRLLRNDVPVPTFNSQVEKALVALDVIEAMRSLVTRPGELARRLDFLLRLDVATQESVLTSFAETAKSVSTPVLLQVMGHFRYRNARAPIRVFFPKGNLAKAFATANKLPNLSEALCLRLVGICEAALLERFRLLPSLGKVYVDPELVRYLVPFSQRSASKSFRTLVRGSRVPLPKATNVLRFFIWWKNGREQTDIDLSATMFDANFDYKDIISFYNLKGYGGCHSGDIMDAPKGASEFIDVTLQKVKEQKVRFIVMTLNSFSQQPFSELPECFAGWMARQKPESGEIYEPKTVQDRLDLTANTQIAIPLIIDVVSEEVIWCDMALKRNPRWSNHVHGNLKGVNLTLQALVDLKKTNLHELLSLHAVARGEKVTSPELAETVFSVKSGLPFRHEEIASGYLV